MIYEMRVYRCLPGRLPALLKRFETITLKLWEKHGIKQAGFFTTLVGESNQELTYFLAWESLADREKKWAAFQSDPEWIAARAKTEEDGQIVGNIVNQLLVPTVFSVGEVNGAAQTLISEARNRVDPPALPFMVAPNKEKALNANISAAPVVAVGSVKFGNDLPISIIAGPCQLESRAHALEVAGGAEGDRRAAEDRPRLQNLVRQGQPHQRIGCARHRAASRRCRSLPKSARRSDCLC